jgi:hypothetical protein
LQRCENEGSVKFEVFEKHDLVAITNEMSKQIQFYKLNQLIKSAQLLVNGNEDNKYINPHDSFYQNDKKLTDLLAVSFTPQTNPSQQVEGLFFADKTGEIHFLNSSKFQSLQKHDPNN